MVVNRDDKEVIFYPKHVVVVRIPDLAKILVNAKNCVNT